MVVLLLIFKGNNPVVEEVELTETIHKHEGKCLARKHWDSGNAVKREHGVMDVSERRADLVKKYEEGLDASFQLSFKAALIIAADGESVADLSAKPISLTRSVLSVSLASLSEKARVRD